MTQTFLPEEWAASIHQSIIDGLERSDELWYGPEEQRRRGHLKKTPYTKAELKARREAIKQWKKLTEELTTKGWLERDHCYECRGELTPSKETVHTEWVYDETEEEHLARVGEPYRPPYVTFTTTPLKIHTNNES